MDQLIEETKRATSVESGGEGSGEGSTADTMQVLEKLEISREFAGILIALRELFRAKQLSDDRMVDFIRQFYEYDTGKMLRPTQLRSLTQHEYVIECDKRMEVNIAAVRRRRSMSSLVELDKMVEAKMKNVTGEVSDKTNEIKAEKAKIIEAKKVNAAAVVEEAIKNFNVRSGDPDDDVDDK